MINSLFSIFEPSNNNILFLLLIPFLTILFPLTDRSRIKILILKIEKLIKKELKISMKMDLIVFIISMIFLVNITINLFSITPFSFTINSQLSFIFPFALRIFLSILSFNLIINYKKTILHLTPLGAPIALSPLLVIIELVRLIIRPITLSVRIIANIMAGHLLMHLLAEFALNFKGILIISSLLSVGLLMAEIIVALIQAYIFSILLSIYITE